jgi:hypothetical protein
MSIRIFSRAAAHPVLKEPTFVFLVLALGLFGAHAAARALGAEVVEIDRTAVDIRIWHLEAERGYPLTAEERARIEERVAEEAILVREARALGLENDPRIEDILVQKMLHVLSAEVIQPTQEELRLYFQANRGRYNGPGAISVAELTVVGQETPPEVIEQLRMGLHPDAITAPVRLVRSNLANVTLGDLATIASVPVAELVFDAAPGSWIGPHRTARGDHWYRAGPRREGPPAQLDEVREQVRWDWITEQEEARLEERVRQLRARYEVVISGRGSSP